MILYLSSAEALAIRQLPTRLAAIELQLGLAASETNALASATERVAAAAERIATVMEQQVQQERIPTSVVFHHGEPQEE